MVIINSLGSKIFLILLLFINEVAAQNAINPNGHNVFRDGNGVVSSEGNMKNGVPDGYWKSYYNTGKIKSQGYWKDGKLDGIWIFYNDNEDTTQTVSYRNGLKNGYLVQYNIPVANDSNSSNTPKSKELFVNNVQTGKSYYFDRQGKLQKELYYIEGLRQGAAKEYDTTGNIITLMEYNKGQIVQIEKINRRDIQNRKQGRWKELYPNDRTKIEQNYLDDLLHGYVKEFSPSGRLENAKRYNKGVLVIAKDDTSPKPLKKETFHDNGELKTSGSFIRDIPVGTHKKYNPEGVVTEAFAYDSLGVIWAKGISDREGLKQDEWEYYFSDGGIKAKGKYKDNNKTGKWSYLYQNGKTEQEGNYLEGKKNGSWLWYYQNGNLLKKEHFRKNKYEGLYIEYTEQGDTITYGEYLDGYKEGPWVYSLGDHKETGQYQYGLKNGEWKHYYADGTLKYSGSFNNDLPDGEHISYYPDGTPRLKAYYRDGQHNETWRFFDENGILTITITYKDGEEYKIDGKKILK